MAKLMSRVVVLLCMVCALAGCAVGGTWPASVPSSQPSRVQATDSTQETGADQAEGSGTAQSDSKDEEEDVQGYKVKITVGGQAYEATFEDNALTRELIGQMPFTISMDNLYGREMCHRYGAGALPTDQLRQDGYQVGDIAYWPPRGSLVILYSQNGEEFERQQVGHVTSGDLTALTDMGTVDVTFEAE